MLKIQSIMNSIDATNGKQSDDFQSSNFNADDEFGDFADFQDNKNGDDDFGDFTFFQGSTNVNNTSYCNSSTPTTIPASIVTHPVTTTTETVTPSTTTSNTFNVNGFRNDDIGRKSLPNYSVINEMINDEFGNFTTFQSDNCDKSKCMDDDEFGDFTFFQDNNKSKLGTILQVKDRDSNTDGDLNFFSTVTSDDTRPIHDGLDDSVSVVETKSPIRNLENTENNDDDDFGDFADFQETNSEITNDGMEMGPSIKHSPSNVLSSTQGMQHEATLDNSLTGNSPLSLIVCQSFPKDIRNGGNKVTSTDLFSNATPQSYKMWQSLINWEEAASLKLNWESSHTFQVFLRSLKIDSTNIQQMPGLRNISTPLIPSKLTILQPTPLIPSIVPLEPQTSQQSHSLTITSDSMNSLDSNKSQEQSASSIPEASFDWNSSGLTNPLEKDWLILL